VTAAELQSKNQRKDKRSRRVSEGSVGSVELKRWERYDGEKREGMCERREGVVKS